MQQILLILLTISVISGNVLANTIWPRPQILTPPKITTGVKNPIVSLNGTWKFNLDPEKNFHENSVDISSWSDVKVPGELVLQGFNIEQNKEYPYKKRIQIPLEFSGKKVILRFHGVYSSARIWVNGHFIKEHFGGFTTWDCDITDWVTPGEDTWLTIGVTDIYDDVSYGSGYAYHLIGGILRNVELIAVPMNYITRFHVKTDLDADYNHAVLRVMTGVSFYDAKEAILELSLTDPLGKTINMTPSLIYLTPNENENFIDIPITSPLKWDAEHPNLYVLEGRLIVDKTHIETVSLNVGFREVEIKGVAVLINGKEIKARGGCRHHMHPTLGRSYKPELDTFDINAYKAANINYIRTSHYPTNQEFLDLADKHGIYIEEEMAVVWGAHHASKGALETLHTNPKYLPWIMNGLAETMERDMSHPSIIVWSMENECTLWGPNLQKELDYARLEDPTRPIKVGHNHYGAGHINDAKLFDLDSYHYPYWNSDLTSNFKPWNFDEFAHVSCYNQSELVRDPGVRNFWGESLKIFWEKMFTSKGCFGGAIWGTIDEVFFLPDGQVKGWGPWGIFDGWRRLKPEYWLTKKAYSPIRIDNAPLRYMEDAKSVDISIKNWFDHTNLNEVTIKWALSGSEEKSGEMMGPDISPHSLGRLTIETGTFKHGDMLNLDFLKKGALIDTFKLPIGKVDVSFPPAKGPAPTITETAENITVTGNNFIITFSKVTGLITRGVYKKKSIIVGGPHLNLISLNTEDWELESISTSTNEKEAVISISGGYPPLYLRFKVSIDAMGLIKTEYQLKNNPPSTSEIGILYILDSKINRLGWKRKGLWSVYPKNHIGRNVGVAQKIRPGKSKVFGTRPEWDYKEDMKDYFLHPITGGIIRGTNDFRSTKENIYFAYAFTNDEDEGIRVESCDATEAVRMDRYFGPGEGRIDDRHPSVHYSGLWTPYTDSGNFNGTESYSNEAGAYVEFTFNGTAIHLIGPKNHNLGIAEVWIDNMLQTKYLDCYAPLKKMYQQVLFSKTGLSDTSHTIKVVVSGRKNPSSSNSYLVIDGFSTQSHQDKDDWSVKLIINNQWSYPGLGWGNYGGDINISPGYRNSVTMRLTEINLDDMTFNDTDTE